MPGLRPTASAAAVGHGSREDQVGKGYFLISDWVADLIFGPRWLRFREVGFVAAERRRAEVSKLGEARWEFNKKPRRGGPLGLSDFLTGIGWDTRQR
jgi:hypothetical protein